MSTLKAAALAREFNYNGIRIPDPGPHLTVEHVRDLLTQITRRLPRRLSLALTRPGLSSATHLAGRLAPRAKSCHQRKRLRRS